MPSTSGISHLKEFPFFQKAKNFEFLLPAAILLLCIFLLQWHSLRFWAGAIGISGYPWSIALELINLWLWFLPGRKWFRPMAWITTALLRRGTKHVLRSVSVACHKITGR